MRIAITADLHLRESHPERLENFEILIDQLLSQGIRILIIAGDLFDWADRSFAQVDSLAGRFPHLHLLIIPGNHDSELKSDFFASANIQVFSQPTLKRIDHRPILFLPYRDGSTMGQVIATSEVSGHLKARQWVLISHGDFSAPRRDANGRERGYFPLTRGDLARFQPAGVILGHIHAPSGIDEEVVSPGSPYPITADEYGRRRILLLDTDTAALQELYLEHPPVYLRSEILVLPDDREEEQIRTQLTNQLLDWEKTSKGQEFLKGLVLHVGVKGYTSSRRNVQRSIETFLSERQISCGTVDLENLQISDSEDLSALANKVREGVSRLKLKEEEGESLRAAVLEKALKIVYGT
ncbi:MAG: metallophosphoesterase [Spirochaetales bacterium]|nr:metallophosphoesterase [Spirochaetales bacterium]